MKFAIRIITIIGVLWLSLQNSYAEFTYNGQNTLTLENYNVSGDQSNGLYSFDGWQSYNDLSVNFSDQYSAYRSMRGYLYTNTNHSQYRGDFGTRINNASITYENGESEMPYRLDAGDFFASQSRHTMQLGLKGVQLELQPQNSAVPHSIQLFFGRYAQDYKTLFEGDKDYYFGGSWLTETTSWGSFALTDVYYSGKDIDGGNDENVASIAWHKEYLWGSFNHEVEAEWSYLNGKNRFARSLSEQSQFLKFSGYKSGGYDYLVSYERNDRLFSPQGAAVTPGRETIDLQWAQPVFRQLNLRLSSQRSRDDIISDNVKTTYFNGINIGGLPFSDSIGLLKNVNFNINLYHQNDNNKDDTIDRDNTVFQIDSSMPVNANWRNRLNYQWSKTDNNALSQSSTRQSIAAGLDYLFEYENWQTTFSPTLRYDQDRDFFNNRTSNFSLGLLIDANKNGHHVLLSHQIIDYRATDSLAIESLTSQTRVEWQKNWNQHGFSIGLDYFNRDPEINRDTGSYKVSAAWVYRFDKQSSFVTPQSIAQLHDFTEFNYLDDLSPGTPLNDNTKNVLRNSAYAYLGNSGPYHLYEGKLLPEIINRQVVALNTDSGGVIKSVSILIPASANPNRTQVLYQKVLDNLLTIYGSPSLNIERGQFSSQWLAELQSNKFSRIIEWTTPGGIIRFGIPRPKTGTPRIEIQLRKQQPLADSNNWGLPVVL